MVGCVRSSFRGGIVVDVNVIGVVLRGFVWLVVRAVGTSAEVSLDPGFLGLPDS